MFHGLPSLLLPLINWLYCVVRGYCQAEVYASGGKEHWLLLVMEERVYMKIKIMIVVGV